MPPQPVLEEIQRKAGSPLPPIPVPANPGDLPPEWSDPVVVTSDTRLGLWYDEMHSARNGYVNEEPGQPWPGTDWILVNYDSGGKPDYKLTLTRRWRRKQYTHVPPGQSFHLTYEEEYGVSETETATLGAELGVDIKGISAKLSASFSTSITVSATTTEKKTFDVTAPRNQQIVWVLWQLVDEVAAMKDGKPIDRFVGTGVVTNPGPGDYDAWLFINTPAVAIPDDVFVPEATAFPAS